MGNINSESIKPINVLVIPAWFSHKDKNAGVFINEFCEQMNSERVNVSLLYLNFYNLKEVIKYLFEKKPEFNYSYAVIVSNLINLKSKLLFFLGTSFILDFYFKKVLNEIKSGDKKFDLIHIQSLCNNITPYIAKRLSKELKLPYVITEHYTSYDLSKGQVFKPYLGEEFVIEVAKKADRRIAVSNYASAMFSKYFNCRFEVISNIINEQFFNSANNINKSEKFTFICIGKLDARKGSMEVLKAFCKFNKEYINSKLELIGSGTLEEEIKAFIQSDNLENNVSVHTWLEKKEIIALMDSSHVLISASELETFGLTIAEAHLRGLPVIATKSGGPEELIDRRNGLLIDLENKESNLCYAMHIIYKNYSEFDSSMIKKEAQVRFDKNKILNSYYTIYNDCKNKLLN